MTHQATLRAIIERELKLRQGEHDKAQRHADEIAEMHKAAMQRLSLARAEVVAVQEAREALREVVR